MEDKIKKYPRLYYPNSLASDQTIELDKAQSHYLGNVLRKNNEDYIRVFNGKNGEFLAQIINVKKKSVTLIIKQQIKEQQNPPHKTLIFAPIKKNRLSFLIEKAVELGVTDFYPVLTEHTQNPKINEGKINTYIIEAAEQCERLTLPTLHKTSPLIPFIQKWPEDKIILWANERSNAVNLDQHTAVRNPVFLVGPEGGFSAAEKNSLSQYKNVKSCALGTNILRAETAAIAMLALTI